MSTNPGESSAVDPRIGHWRRIITGMRPGEWLDIDNRELAGINVPSPLSRPSTINYIVSGIIGSSYTVEIRELENITRIVKHKDDGTRWFVEWDRRHLFDKKSNSSFERNSEL